MFLASTLTFKIIPLLKIYRQALIGYSGNASTILPLWFSFLTLQGMSEVKPKVLVTFDSMKNSNTGYYYFGKGLGNALLANNLEEFDLSFYLHKRTKYNFNGQVPIIRLSKFHPYYFTFRNSFNLVHFADQECRLKPQWVNAKKVMTIHDINRLHLQSTSTKELESYMHRLRTFVNEVDAVVAISNFVANDIRQFFPEAINKLSVIYNGADKLVSMEGHTPAIIPKGDFLFTIGVLSPQKGFHYLPCLLQNNDLNLVIAGTETPHLNKILEEARKYNCEDRIFITGPVSDADKAWYYAYCKAFVFPSIAEGFGLPVIEAMHFGKPVFLARRTSLPEVGGEAAYYFDNFEPENMRAVLQNGLEDFATNNRTDDIIKQAKKFSWDNAAKSYLQLYTKCLSA